MWGQAFDDRLSSKVSYVLNFECEICLKIMEMT